MTGGWASARADLYRFLATAWLRPPVRSLVAPFLDAGVLAELEGRFGPEAVAELHRFHETFQGGYDALDREYHDLLVVPLGRYVTPYEAVYRDERVVGDTVVRGLLMGPSTLAVMELYREAGLEVADDLLELPDHVGLELACMELLCRNEASASDLVDDGAVDHARDLQRRLLEEHLQAWVPSLCARVRENATGPFYRGIAALTEAVLRQEREEMAGTARFP